MGLPIVRIRICWDLFWGPDSWKPPISGLCKRVFLMGFVGLLEGVGPIKIKSYLSPLLRAT